MGFLLGGVHAAAWRTLRRTSRLRTVRSALAGSSATASVVVVAVTRPMISETQPELSAGVLPETGTDAGNIQVLVGGALVVTAAGLVATARCGARLRFVRHTKHTESGANDQGCHQIGSSQ